MNTYYMVTSIIIVGMLVIADILSVVNQESASSDSAVKNTIQSSSAENPFVKQKESITAHPESLEFYDSENRTQVHTTGKSDEDGEKENAKDPIDWTAAETFIRQLRTKDLRSNRGVDEATLLETIDEINRFSTRLDPEDVPIFKRRVLEFLAKQSDN